MESNPATRSGNSIQIISMGLGYGTVMARAKGRARWEVGLY